MKNSEKTMDKIVALCKNRGFIFPGSEIYGGLANSWDYGPLGVEFKNNVKKAWWIKVLMTHIGGYPGRYAPEARKLIDSYKPDIFICGHSHILKVVRDTKRNMLVVNPGATGIQGFHVVRTALRFKIEDGNIHSMEVFECDRK